MATEHNPTPLPSPQCHNTHVCVCGRRGRIRALCLPSSSLTASEVCSPVFILQGKRFLCIFSAVFSPASLKWVCHPLQMPIRMMHTSGRLRPGAKWRKPDKPRALSQLVDEEVVEGFLARISDSSSLQGDSPQPLHTSLLHSWQNALFLQTKGTCRMKFWPFSVGCRALLGNSALRSQSTRCLQVYL